MSFSRIHPDERWTRFLDRDIDRILNGTTPDNSDLSPLLPVLAEVRGYATIDLPDAKVNEIATAASGIVAARIALANTDPAGAGPGSTSRFRQAARTIRTKVTATVASFVMLSGLTGVAWASDGAVPGDWNYGIDRALESIGIGAGGAEERLSELAVLRSEDRPGASAATPAASQADTSGLEKAADAVITHGAVASEDVRNNVSTLLLHLLNSGDVNGADIAEMAKNIAGRPEDLPSRGNQKPDNHGKSSEAGSKSPSKP